MSYYSSFTSNGLMVGHDIVPYKNLRNAIVIRACNDYKNALKKYAKGLISLIGDKITEV